MKVGDQVMVDGRQGEIVQIRREQYGLLRHTQLHVWALIRYSPDLTRYEPIRKVKPCPPS